MARSLKASAVLLFAVLALVPCPAPGIGEEACPVPLSAPARRVVSLYTAHSENVLALGAGSALVAVSGSDDPGLFPGAVRLPVKVDAEAVLALSPDLVLIRPLVEEIQSGLVDVLKRSGVPVVSLAPPTWDSMESYLTSLGRLLGVDAPHRLWKETVEELRRRVPAKKRPLVFLESSSRGLKTCSPSSWAAHVIALAGGENAARDAVPLSPGSSLASWGEERLLDMAREGLDVYLVQVGAMNAVTEEEVRSRPWISGLGGAKIVLVDEEWISRPSLLRLQKGVELLREIFFGTEATAP